MVKRIFEYAEAFANITSRPAGSTLVKCNFHIETRAASRIVAIFVIPGPLNQDPLKFS